MNGHAFEGYDTISEICSACGLIREYQIKDGRNREATIEEAVHICWTAGDHAFGQSGMCIYCGKAENSLTTAEQDQYVSIKQARRGD